MVKFPLIIIFLVCFVQYNRVFACYTSIFSFGDSLADTGNLRYIEEYKHQYDYSPYGKTFFGHPTGRCSDGRLVIDFIAQGLGLPLIPPYHGDSNRDFSQGVNFAVTGATAIESAFFEERGMNLATNASLGVQLGWFKDLLSSLCNSTSSCSGILRNSLFLVGEIGGNDYNYPFFQGKDIHDIPSLVPKVINTMSSAITALIEQGAKTLMVPGNLPIGCSAAYLTIYQSENKADYDPSNGCLIWLNEFAQYHNQLLQNELDRLRELHPHATIIYVDYYNVAMELYNSPRKLGFKNTVSACCGGEGPYNYNAPVKCGLNVSRSCDDVSSYVSWDGVHLTEATYKWIATGILKGTYTTPRFQVSCKADS
ncbi:acetylajmaline esterase [Ranunculus cassubicifolius]